MGRESDEVQAQLDARMKAHEVFKQHVAEYHPECHEHRVEVINTNQQLSHAREQAAAGGPDAAKWQAEVQHLEEEQRELDMVDDRLRQDLEELRADFAELKTPENDVVELARKLRKLKEADLPPRRVADEQTAESPAALPTT